MIDPLHQCGLCNSSDNLKSYEQYEAFFLAQCRKYRPGTQKAGFAFIGGSTAIMLQADNLWQDQRHALLNTLEICTNIFRSKGNIK